MNGARLRLTALIAGAVMAAGCASRPPLHASADRLRTAFDAAEHAPYMRAGSGSLSGQAFLRQRGGAVVTCAGSAVKLLPATEFFREWSWYIKEGRRVEHEDAFLLAAPSLLRETQCDAQGNFVFTDLPAGRFAVITSVFWSAGYSRQGGFLMQEVELQANQSRNLILSTVNHLR